MWIHSEKLQAIAFSTLKSHGNFWIFCHDVVQGFVPQDPNYHTNLNLYIFRRRLQLLEEQSTIIDGLIEIVYVIFVSWQNKEDQSYIELSFEYRLTL